MSKVIVIVDDFKTNTVVIRHALITKGFEILEANDGNEALKFFDGRQIDLMVTDFKMPSMTGAELTTAVKSKPQYKNLPVLILSSEKSEQCKSDARKAGAYGWLNKPFDLERFIKIINSIFK
jgi:two-component system chemotaxis response regulator CheY